MARLRKLRDEHGFTIVETLVAAVVLLVGMAGVVTVVDQASSTTTSVKAREQGTALNRELIEAAHSIPYGSLTPSTLVSTVQAMPGLANAGAGQGWTITRRGIVYTVAMGVCSVDDAADGLGAHTANTFCADGAGTATPATCAKLIGSPANIAGTAAAVGAGNAIGDCGLDTNHDGFVDNLVDPNSTNCPATGTCDTQPEDYKRLVVLVTWDRGGGSRYVLDSSTVPFGGLATAPTVTSLTPGGVNADGTGAYDIVPDANGSTPSSITFTATTDRQAQSVIWSVNGTDQATVAGPGTTFTFTWNIGTAGASETSPSSGEAVDGSYLITARAVNAAGLHGASYSDSMVLNRRVPFPVPSGSFIAGLNNGSVNAQWSPDPFDKDLVGYVVYRQQSTGGASAACGSLASPIPPPANTAATMTCTDSNPGSPPVNYWVVAVDRTPAADGSPTGATRAGQASNVVTVTSNNAPPTTPSNLQISTSINGGGNFKTVTLTWNASTDTDDSIAYYEIYIDGTSVPANFDNKTKQLTYSEKFPSTASHTYYVRAIDSQGAPSPFTAGATSG